MLLRFSVEIVALAKRNNSDNNVGRRMFIGKMGSDWKTRHPQMYRMEMFCKTNHHSTLVSAM